MDSAYPNGRRRICSWKKTSGKASGVEGQTLTNVLARVMMLSVRPSVCPSLWLRVGYLPQTKKLAWFFWCSIVVGAGPQDKLDFNRVTRHSIASHCGSGGGGGAEAAAAAATIQNCNVATANNFKHLSWLMKNCQECKKIN